MPHVIERARSQQYDITVPTASVSRPPFSTPQPPRNRPGPPESVRISFTVVTTGDSRSCPSTGWVARPTPKMGAVAFDAVAPVPSAPAAGHPVVPHEDRPAGLARVAPAHQQVLEVERARQGPLRHHPRPQLEDRVHDLLVRPGAEPGDRDRPGRVHDGALRAEVDGHGPVEAGVERHVREERLRARVHRRGGGAEPGVQERADRRVRAVQVVVDAVAVDRHPHPDRDQALVAGRIEVEVVDGLVDAVRQRRDPGPREALHVVLHLRERRLDGVDAVAADEPQDLALARPRRLRLGVHVAVAVARHARVGDDQAADVGPVDAAVPEPHRRHPQALAEVLLRVDVERARDGSADIGPVPVRLRVGDDPARRRRSAG